MAYQIRETKTTSLWFDYDNSNRGETTKPEAF